MRYIKTAFILILIIFITACTTLEDSAADRDSRPTENYELAGRVNVSTENWNWLFLQSGEELAEKLKKSAEEKAAELYGPEAVIMIEHINGSWNPKSLLMLFNTLGFVENAELEASVWRPAPKKPELAPEPELKYGIRYRVIPAENYSSPEGFTEVVYKTRQQLETELAEAFSRGDFSEEDYEKKKSRLPETGKIFITLGREDITNAISRWFTFTCTYEDRTVFRKRGTEDIPYVYGTDKLWWNDKSFKIDTAWDSELLLTIKDSYQNKDFDFRIVKERYVITE